MYEGNGLNLVESHVIAKYLCEEYGPNSGLYSNNIKERLQVDQMLEFNIGMLMPALKPYLVCSFI